jgi:hypothetical protein
MRTTLVVLITTILSVELAAFIGSAYLVHRGIVYRPHEDLSDYPEYLARRDPVLGWIIVTDEDRLAEDGSRFAPRYADAGLPPPCVALYGDSFVWADEVGDEQAWAEQLTGVLGCRVANYGVRAYGTDQAFLRFRTSGPEQRAPLVVMGYMTENIMRNVNQDFDLIYGFTKYGLKPRFTLSETGELTLVPLPTFTAAEFEVLNRSPAEMLPHEYFVPIRLGFPYTLTVLRAIDSHRIRARLGGVPQYAEFYGRDHPSGALAVTGAILEAFVAEARGREVEPLVLLIPTLMDFEHHARTGEWIYAPLLDDLRGTNVPFFEVGPAILEKLGSRPLASIFAPQNHYNDAGNRLLAEVIFDEISRRGPAPTWRSARDATEHPEERERE